MAKSSQETRDGGVEKQVHGERTLSRSLHPLYKIKHRKCRNKGAEKPEQ